MSALKSWITKYSETINLVSESPLQFNLWAGMSVVSSVLKKNLWISYRTFKIYPNQYIVLIAPPGIGKGEAIHPAHRFAKEAGLVNYMSDRITAPKIIENLHAGFAGLPTIVGGQVLNGPREASATLISSELPTLVGSSDWMLTFLCDAWDKGEFEYGTRNKGTFNVTNMCVSLIGACVPDYVRRLNRDTNSAVASGFTARTIFVNADCKSKVLAWGEPFWDNPKYKQVIEELSDELKDIARMKGEVFLEEPAKILWNRFYNEHYKSYNADDTDVYNNFRSRQPVHVLKACITLTAAENTHNIVTQDILRRAIIMVENIAEGVDEIFRGVGESEISAGLARFKVYFERKCQPVNGSGPRSVGYNKIVEDNIRYVDHDDIVRILKILEVIGYIEPVTGSNGLPSGYKWTGKKQSNTSDTLGALFSNGTI